jgi:hypothetical protein
MMRLRREMEVEYARETEAQAASAAKVARIVQTGLSVLDQVRSIDYFGCGWGHCWRVLQLAEVRKEQEDEGDFDTDSPDDSPMEDENGDNTKDDGEVQVRDEVEGHAKDEGEGEEVKGEVKRQWFYITTDGQEDEVEGEVDMEVEEEEEAEHEAESHWYGSLPWVIVVSRHTTHDTLTKCLQIPRVARPVAPSSRITYPASSSNLAALSEVNSLLFIRFNFLFPLSGTTRTPEASPHPDKIDVSYPPPSLPSRCWLLMLF